MWYKILLVGNTLKFLKPVQLVYQLWYRVKAKIPVEKRYEVSLAPIKLLEWEDGVFNLETYKGPYTFSFLNIAKSFDKSIDWNFDTHKKLWTYNLNYFDFLNQVTMSAETGLGLIKDFITNYDSLKDGKEPYPTSLRIINWVKFIAKHNINNESINCKIKEDANRLCASLEYHLLANHLLENGFALWFAAHLFDEMRYFKIVSKILKTQLEEQILEDGGHFELSPMYHNLMLYRVLDCIKLAEVNKSAKTENLVLFLREKAAKMLSWSKQMTFSSGAMPLFNDAANNINPNPFDVMSYAEKLQVKKFNLPLKDSGYRTFKNEFYELIADVGQLGPSYQPGHAHADTFNFELFVNNKPIIVDRGISTYNISDERIEERSTTSHNTVAVNFMNSSQVWGGFRVGKRAKVKILNNSKTELKAIHYGYNNLKVSHQRRWYFESHSILIEDNLSQNTFNNCAFFHFHPDVKVIYILEKTVKADSLEINFNGDIIDIVLEKYNYNNSFNDSRDSKRIVISFKSKLTTKIIL